MPKVYIRTYGCQMNERDSEQVAQMFSEGGYTVTADEAEADAVLVNTCSVRDQAEQKALGKMGSMGSLRRTKPHVVYGFMGCMAQSRGPELFQRIPHLDVVVGTQKYHKVFEYVDAILQRRLERRMDELELSLHGENVCDVEEESGSQNTIRDHIPKELNASAFVSIMQGCNMRCSFCIVPDTRGKERGRPIAEIVDEVKRLRDHGVKEVTLLGQIVNLYGRTEFEKVDGKSPFVQLLEAVHAVEGIERIRFTSPHPIGYRDDLVAAFTYLPKLCPHIHFPMQSGSDRILKAMRRPYKNEKFVEICEKMKAARPGLAITTDIIVGFPGETDADFEELLAWLKEAQLDRVGCFEYSPVEGASANALPGAVPDEVKAERHARFMQVQEKISRAKLKRKIGKTIDVLVDGTDEEGLLVGRSKADAPEIDGKVYLSCDRPLRAGQVVQARVLQASEHDLNAEVLTDD